MHRMHVATRWHFVDRTTETAADVIGRELGADMRGTLAWVVVAVGLLLGFSQPSSADVPATGVLTVQITGLRSNNGQIGCMIYNSPKGFPEDSAAALQRRWCLIANSTSTCAFDPIPAG